MQLPVNLKSLDNLLARLSIFFPYDPGGLRSHDLRIKRSFPTSAPQGLTECRTVSEGRHLSPKRARTDAPACQSHVTRDDWHMIGRGLV